MTGPGALRLGNLPPHFTTETVADMIHQVTGFVHPLGHSIEAFEHREELFQRLCDDKDVVGKLKETHLYYIETNLNPEYCSIEALVKFRQRNNLELAFKKFSELQCRFQGSPPAAVTLLSKQSPEYRAQVGFIARSSKYLFAMEKWLGKRKDKIKNLIAKEKKTLNETQKTGNDKTKDNQALNVKIPTESARPQSSKSCSSPETNVEKITEESNDNMKSFESIEEAVIKENSAEFIDAQTEDSNDSTKTVVLTPIKLEQFNDNEDQLKEHKSNTNTTVLKQKSIENVTDVVETNTRYNPLATVVKQEQTDLCKHHQPMVEDTENINSNFFETTVKLEPMGIFIGPPLVIFDDPVDISISGNSLATVVKLEPTDLSNDHTQDVVHDSVNTNASCDVLKNIIGPEPMNHKHVSPRIIVKDSVTFKANISAIEAVVKRELKDREDTPPSVVTESPESSVTFNTNSNIVVAVVEQEPINLCDTQPPVVFEEPNDSVRLITNSNTKRAVVKQEPIDLGDTQSPVVIEKPKSSVTFNLNSNTKEAVVKQEPIDLCDTPPPVVIKEPMSSVILNTNSNTIEAVVKQEPINLFGTQPSVVVEEPNNSVRLSTNSNIKRALQQEPIVHGDKPSPVVIEEPKSSVTFNTNSNTIEAVVKQEPIDLGDTPPPIEEPMSSVTFNTNSNTIVQQEQIDLCDTPPPVIIEESVDTGCNSPATVVNRVTDTQDERPLVTAATDIDEILDSFDPSVMEINEEPRQPKKKHKKAKRGKNFNHITSVYVRKLPPTKELSKNRIKYELLKKINKKVDDSEEIVFIIENETGNSPFSTALIKLETHFEAVLVRELLDGFKVGNNVIEAVMDNKNKLYKYINKSNQSKRKLENTNDAYEPSAKQTKLNTGCGHQVLPIEKSLYGLRPEFLSKVGACMPLSNAIIIENLHEEVNEMKIHEVFSMAGDVKYIQLHKDIRKARVQFDHPVEAVQALHMFKQQKLFDKPLVMQMEPASCERPLPVGLSGVNRGFGKNGEALKAVRTVIELGSVHEILYEMNKMNKFESNDISSPFNVRYSKRNTNGESNVTKTIPSPINVTDTSKRNTKGESNVTKTIPSHINVTDTSKRNTKGESNVTKTIPSHINVTDTSKRNTKGESNVTKTIPSPINVTDTSKRNTKGESNVTKTIPSPINVTDTSKRNTKGESNVTKTIPSPINVTDTSKRNTKGESNVTKTIPSPINVTDTSKRNTKGESNVTKTIPSPINVTDTSKRNTKGESNVTKTIPSPINVTEASKCNTNGESNVTKTIPSPINVTEASKCNTKGDSNVVKTIPSPINVTEASKCNTQGESNVTKTIPSPMNVTSVQNLDKETSWGSPTECQPFTSQAKPQNKDMIVGELGALLKKRGLIPTHTDCKDAATILAALLTKRNKNSCNMYNMNPQTNADAFRNNFDMVANMTNMPSGMPSYGGVPHPMIAPNQMVATNTIKNNKKKMVAPNNPMITPNPPSVPPPPPPTTELPPLPEPLKAQSRERDHSREPRLNTWPDNNRLMDEQEEDEITKVIFRNLPASVTQAAMERKMAEVGGVLCCLVTGGGAAVVGFRSFRYADRCIRLFHQSKVDGQTIEAICI